MADRRIRVARDKEAVVRRLVAGENSTGPFKLIAEAIVFAAALGACRGNRVPLGDLSKDIEPIRRGVFDSRGYDTLMNLLATHAEKSPSILASNETAEDTRATIFEEYANGGFQILEQELRGAVDVLENLVLMLQAESQKSGGSQPEDFDLTTLIG